jgi:hypothetical protein
MNDLIDRQAAIDALNKLKIYRPLDSDRYVISDCLNKIVNLPSTQPEIIRCRDCKWSDWYDSTDGNRYCYCMETGASGRTADDFCSYAERRKQ